MLSRGSMHQVYIHAPHRAARDPVRCPTSPNRLRSNSRWRPRNGDRHRLCWKNNHGRGAINGLMGSAAREPGLVFQGWQVVFPRFTAEARLVPWPPAHVREFSLLIVFPTNLRPDRGAEPTGSAFALHIAQLLVSRACSCPSEMTCTCQVEDRPKLPTCAPLPTDTAPRVTSSRHLTAEANPRDM